MTDLVDLAWIIITQLGEDRFYLAVLVIVYLGIERKLGVKVATYAMTSVWINSFLKDLLMIPRPPPQNWKIQVEGYGFPSGHAQGVTVIMGYLASKVRSHLAYSVAASLVLLVSCSRLALVVHSVYDVVGGVLIGLAILVIGWFVESKVSPKMLKDQGRLAWLALPIVSAILSSVIGIGGDDSFRAAGALFGLLVGYMILEEKRTKEPGSVIERITNVVVGLIVAVSLYYSVGEIVSGALPVFLALAATGFLASVVPAVTTVLFRQSGGVATRGIERQPRPVTETAVQMWSFSSGPKTGTGLEIRPFSAPTASPKVGRSVS